MTSHAPAPAAALEKGCQPDPDASVDFLRQFAPEGPWALTAIVPDRGGIETRTFRPESEDAMKAWLANHNGNSNLYFHVNPTIRDISKKARREDIKSLAWLHVDIDPRAGEDIEEERARALGILTDKLPKDVPAPTCIIFSGGGYQAFWKLTEPIEINGDLAKAEDAKLYNLQIEILFGADRCHNVDRIMRLPGTINIPDAKKRERGRVEALAKVFSFDENCNYAIDKFTQAPTDKPKEPQSGGGESLKFSGEAQRVADLSELDKWDVLGRVKVIINNGHHPDEPKKGDNSRSAWLYDVCCNLLRCKVPPAIVFGIITDPVWPISESVLEQKADAEKYARRQIERGLEAVEADAIEFEVNDKGLPYANQNNIRVALRKLGVQLSQDQFADRLLIEGLPGHGPVLQDEGVTALYLIIDERFGFRPTKDFFWMVVEDQARRNAFHPVRDYLDGLDWDGNPRLDTWLIDYGGAEDSPYVQAVGALVLIAAVRRIRRPGCKFDEMLVLRSPQGTQKSTALQALVPTPDWFSDDLPLGADTKVIIERLHGRWIVEAAELKGMRNSAIEHQKAFLSRQIDRARMAYGRITKEMPRQCVFIGTTNSERFLRDTTGDRRYWPVPVDVFDVEAIKRDRDQLWAEAVHREETGASIRLDPALWPAATEAQKEHRLDDPFAMELERVLGDRHGKLRAADAWEIIGTPPGLRTQDQNARLGEAMRELGWKRKKGLQFNGRTENGYVRGEQPWSQIVIEPDPTRAGRAWVAVI